MGQQISITITGEPKQLEGTLEGLLKYIRTLDGEESTDETPAKKKTEKKKPIQKTLELEDTDTGDDTDATDEDDTLTPEKKRELVKPYLEKNKASVKKLLDKIGAARVSDVADDDWDTFFSAVKKIK